MVDFGISTQAMGRLLVNTPLFAGLDPASWDGAIVAFRPRPFADGEPLVSGSSPPPGLLVLVDGEAEVWLREGERRVCVGRYLRGDVMGACSIFGAAGLARPDVIGLGDGLAALLPVDAWRRLAADRRPAVLAMEVAILRFLCRRLEGTLDGALEVLAGPAGLHARAAEEGR